MATFQQDMDQWGRQATLTLLARRRELFGRLLELAKEAKLPKAVLDQHHSRLIETDARLVAILAGERRAT